MRPLKLTMQAFGPFANKIEIDFEKLGSSNIYLISGVTGSGKTSIFDAISYALFNTSSGSIRGNNTLRSHYAQDNEESYVEFSFLFNNQKYLIKRTPSYERKKTRGEGFILEQAKAQIHLPNGKIIEKVKEVDEFVVELLGINSPQFSQIALLAQGEFLKLLNSDTQTRAEIFRNIFKTWNYSDFQNKLKDNSNDLKNEYLKLENLIMQLVCDVVSNSQELSLIKDNYLKNNYFDDLKEFIKILDEQNKNDEINLNNIKKEVENFENSIKTSIQTYQKIQTKIKFINKIDEIKKQLDMKTLEQNEINAEYKTLAKKEKHLEKLALEIEKNNENYKKVQEVKELILQKENMQKELDVSRADVVVMQDKQNEIKKEFLQFLFNQYFCLNEEIEKMQKEFNSVEVNAKNSLNLFQENYTKYLKNQAGILAKSLKEDEECPVCGSKIHPQLAKVEDETLTQEYVDFLKLESENLNLKLAEISKNILLTKEKSSQKLVEFQKQSKNFKIEIEQKFLKIKEINFELEINNLQNKIELNNENILNTLNEIKVLNGKIELVMKDFSNNSVEEISKKQNELNLEYSNLKNEIEKIEKNYQNFNIEFEKLQSNLNLLETQMLEYKEVDISKLEEISQFISNVEKQIKDCDDKLSIIISRKSINENILSSLILKNDEYLKIKQKYEHYKLLSDCANGNLKSKAKIPFEQYIQGYYLDLVLFEANKHLKTMTQNQFQLFRKTAPTSLQGKTGLELEVMDFHTYKKRSTKTLSGGESFKAALSLALGLSECISNFSGAINIEALFIDEGFGTLDSESLELAMDVIFGLTTNNRIIGLISHIDELKLKIENQIIVKKTQKGSQITLNFN